MAAGLTFNSGRSQDLLQLLQPKEQPVNTSDLQNDVNNGGLTLGGGSGAGANSGGNPSGGTGGGSDPYAKYGGQTAYNNQAGLYDQGIGNINSAIGRLPGQKSAAESNIETSYQNALNQLLGGKNQAQGAYTTSKTQSAQDYRTSKNSILRNAGNSLNGLLRLLGIRGAGGGSAYRFNAPQAVTNAASQQRGDVGQSFGRNNQALDTNWNNYLTGYNNSVLDVGNQRDSQRHGVEDQFNSNNATLLQQLATLQAQKAAYTGGNAAAASQGSIDQANALLNTVGNYSTQPIAYNTQAYNAPSLESYTVNPNAAPTAKNQGGGDVFSPYLASLLGKDKNRQQFGY